MQSIQSATKFEQQVQQDTWRWLERVVLGLQLCPFARQPWESGRIRIQVSPAESITALAEDLHAELLRLDQAAPMELETTLLVHPAVLADFLDFNDFLEIADEMVAALELEGVVQIASFHPQYRFADTSADDPANCTNRTPYPTLHLLREASVERAVATMGAPEEIYQRNIEVLDELGIDGWLRLLKGD
ncbi:MAG: DUF1415 domain-containing protein [Wenzhouxiangellaceae bacterium]|nr:DUF1415 domain-containing protein [Wenzhouxiangellaceae bacterium]